VTADESKAGSGQVIECQCDPVTGDMAVRALAAVAAFVNVIRLVAGIAGGFDIREAAAVVTRRAAHAFMCAA